MGQSSRSFEDKRTEQVKWFQMGTILATNAVLGIFWERMPLLSCPKNLPEPKFRSFRLISLADTSRSLVLLYVY